MDLGFTSQEKSLSLSAGGLGKEKAGGHCFLGYTGLVAPPQDLTSCPGGVWPPGHGWPPQDP